MEESTRIEESQLDTLFSYNNVPMLEENSIAYGSLQADAQDYSGDDDGNSLDPTNEFGSAFTSTEFVEHRAKKRRKQSNPVRYQMTQVLDTEERDELVSDEALNLKIRHQNTSKELDKSLRLLLKCHYCSSLFQSEELLRVHVEEEHVQKLLEKQLHHQSHNKSTSLNSREANNSESQENSESVRTTEASSFTLFNDQRLSTMPISYASTSSFGSRDFTKNSFFPSMPPLIPISHSADGKPPNMSLPLNMFPSSIAPFLFPVLPQLQEQNSAAPNSLNPSNRIFNPEAYCELCNKEFCNKYFLKTHKANKHAIYSVEPLISSSYPGTFLSNNRTNPIPLPPPLLQNLPTRQPTPQQGIMNVEAFCEICQKELCNKYFLKKHKYRIHGIQESQKVSGTSDNSVISPEKNKTSPTTLTTESSEHTFSTLFSVQSNVFFNQTMLPKLSSSVETVTTSATVSITSKNKILLPPKEDSSNSEKGATNLTPDKLKEIGVINTDAFCELCCKQFCNKYFLHIHRIKKHSINVSESNSKDGQSSGEHACSPVLSEAGQVLPFSSIPGTVLQESHSKQEDMYVYREGVGESICELCNRPFASLHLLKMHMFYTHNIPHIKEEENSKPNSPVDPQQPLTSSSVNYTTTEIFQQQVKSSKSFPEESSGQDLQRLQTMIKELNAPLKINDNRVTCSICGLQFDSKYYLRAHTMNEHGYLLNEDRYSTTSLETQKTTDHIMHFKQSLCHPLASSPSVAVHEVEASCEICQKKFSSKYFLRIHKQNIHNIPVDDNNGTSDQFSLKSTQPGSTSKPIPSPTINNKSKVLTGSNFCNICNKELCNKYFMKTHMLKMHGVDLNEQPKEAAKISTIGGVTCDVCQKELCSKYFLKVHKQNTHGIYEEPPPSKESLCQSSVQSAGSSNQNLLPGELVDSQHFSHYTEICPLCDRRFKSIKWLKTHIINDHNAAKKDILSSPENVFFNEIAVICVICGQSFADQVALQVHLIKDHRTSTEELGITSSSGIKITQDSSGVMIQDQLDNPVNGSVSPRASSMSMDFLEGKEETELHHCSYCTYTTRWLSNLYAHEKRHTTMIVDREKKFFCRICHRAYRYSHSLQRHLLSHRTVGVSAKNLSHPLKPTSKLFTETNGEQKKRENFQNENGHSQVKPRIKVKRYRCSKCDKKFRTRELCLTHIHAFHNSKKLILNQQKILKSFHCPVCGFISRAWNMLKQHIYKQHENSPEILRRAELQHFVITDASIPDNREIASENLTEPVLREFPFQPDLPSTDHGTREQPPMSYSMPHNPHTTGTFIMQPFFLAQPEMDGNVKNDNFVPSLVYLPVCHKISQPMTVAFSLTPA